MRCSLVDRTEKNGQNEVTINEKAYQGALKETLEKLSIPEGYEFKEVRDGKQDKSNVWIFRYEKSNGENNGLGGEHFSFTVNQDNYKILGVQWMDQRFVKGQQLPSSKQALTITEEFINHIQPGLFKRMENTWIRPEDATLTIDGQKKTITGIRTKFFLPSENRWAWAIIGPDNSIMSFEQEMVWMGGRISEMWLHDNWLLKGGDNTIGSKIKRIFSKF